MDSKIWYSLIFIRNTFVSSSVVDVVQFLFRKKCWCKEMVWIPDKSLPPPLCLINHPLRPTEQYVQPLREGPQFIQFLLLQFYLHLQKFATHTIYISWSTRQITQGEVVLGKQSIFFVFFSVRLGIPKLYVKFWWPLFLAMKFTL